MTITSGVEKPLGFAMRLPRPLWIFVIATAIIAVSASLRIGVPVYQRRAVIREIKRWGGRSTLENRAPEWVRTRFGHEWTACFDDVVRIDLDGTQADDTALARLSWLSDLQELRLDNTRVTDAGLAHLSGLSNLKILWLDNRQVTDEGVQHLAHLSSLRELSLNGTPVTDVGLVHLTGLTNLRWLFLNDTNVSNRCLIHLADLRRLEGVWLNKTHVNAVGAARLKRALPRLQQINIGN